jgi:hypothetical protein
MHRRPLILNQILIGLLLILWLLVGRLAGRRFLGLISALRLVGWGLGQLGASLHLARIARESRIILRYLIFARWQLIGILFTFLEMLRLVMFLLIAGLDQVQTCSGLILEGIRLLDDGLATPTASRHLDDFSRLHNRLGHFLFQLLLLGLLVGLRLGLLPRR